MININLLPDVVRKKERMPMPQLLVICATLAVLGLLGYFTMNYQLNVVPELARRRAVLEQQKREAQAKSDEWKKINEEITRLSGYVNTVKTLYVNRVVWGKILSDIKNIVNFDSIMSQANPEMRYLWLDKLSGKGKNISLSGFATSSNMMVGQQMLESLLQGFRTYRPFGLPEKGEEERLQEELRAVMVEYAARRREDPKLPEQGEEEAAIRKRQEEIKTIRSGGIAMLPFSELLVPGSIRLINTTVTQAPKPRGAGMSGEMLEMFPSQAWSFGISMALK
ncbi:MAG: hypothetical protein LBU23_04175 [Planctomycetota bacterium]|jgi:Tfp pilus assembly protein PilN|nr:hypothetical protein [Planctomycetota bacterium]